MESHTQQIHDSLLDLVKQHEAEKCQETQSKTLLEIRKLLRQTRHEARLQVHQAIKEERKRIQRKLASYEAQLSTAKRRANHEQELKILERVFNQLLIKIKQAWQDKNSRTSWILASLAQAKDKLSDKANWCIECPAELNTNEIKASIEKLGLTVHNEIIAKDFTEGLRICCVGVCVDTRLQGLMANESLIKAQIVEEINLQPG